DYYCLAWNYNLSPWVF
nr:immunoglobulin light chain junction region [Macaca mulatta]MOY04974.1 immunoglobulin light chain junction region [Macaca mulatta]MOY05073.1 immunoglobulin light chain junction region [Macaca mulatta]MOY05171.1 immunoglobulin light chain junction region [Macaca mulatta]MOY05181.1 immunoglobulin light chain junction region [Macaca mulatta]